MTLPPSPPVWSPVQAEAARAEAEQTSSSSSSAIAIAQHQPSHLQPTQRYSRSLSNYSSSAPSHHPDYLAAFRPARPSETKADDDDDSEADTQGVGGVRIHKPSSSSSSASSASSGLDLSKSPTILSLLSSQHSGDSSASASSGDASFYRRPSLIESHIAEGEEEDDDDGGASRGDRGRRTAGGSEPTPAVGGADDLQFSISLDAADEEDEADDEGGDTGEFISDVLY